MADLIEREAVMKALQTIHTHDGMEISSDVDYVEACSAIYNIPAVDAEPVRHGRWVEKEVYDGDVYYDCSACGESWVLLDGNPADNGMDYCPHCGARMGMEEES